MVPPPSRLMSPSVNSPPPPQQSDDDSKQWICDFCNVAAFATYEEACTHEEICGLPLCRGGNGNEEEAEEDEMAREVSETNTPQIVSSPPSSSSESSRKDQLQPPQQQQLPSCNNSRRSAEEDDDDEEDDDSDDEMETTPMKASAAVSSSSSSRTKQQLQRPKQHEMGWFSGTLSLVMDADAVWLDELQQFIRQECIELFSASSNYHDLASSRRPGMISEYRVGVRCRFCCPNTTHGCVSFPKSVFGIYASMQRYSKLHLPKCPGAPPHVVSFLAKHSKITPIPGTPTYWNDASLALGCVDTDDGIRFEDDPQGEKVKERRRLFRSGVDDASTASTSAMDDETSEWFAGSMSLEMEADRDWLLELHCVIRKYCLEFFTAPPNHGYPIIDGRWISVGRVGIRCRCCYAVALKEHKANQGDRNTDCLDNPTTNSCIISKHQYHRIRRPAPPVPTIHNRDIKSTVSFPLAIEGLYGAMLRYARMHLPYCPNIPPDLEERLANTEAPRSDAPAGTNQYWVNAAKALGLVNTEDGIRFEINPMETKILDKRRQEFRHIISTSDGAWTRGPLATAPPGNDTSPVAGASPGSSTMEGVAKNSGGAPIIHPEDEDKIPPYYYFVYSQVETCHLNQERRRYESVTRKGGRPPVGYPGFQCRYCHGDYNKGGGQYFPRSARSLWYRGSVLRYLHGHLLKCHNVPQEIRSKLVDLKKMEKERLKLKTPILPSDWRQDFFETYVWPRMHG